MARGCARVSLESNMFFLFSSAKLSIASLAAAHPNGVGLTQIVRRLSVVSTNMGRVLLYALFLTGQPSFEGRQVSPAIPCILPFFRVSVGALDVRAASGHSQHFLLIRETGVCFFSWLAAPCVRSGWPGPGMCARDARV